MSNDKIGNEPAGLPSDQGEDGSVLRIKDVLRPLDPKARGGSAILGFASDEGVRRNHGRIGAAGGPAAIRSMLARLPIHRPVSLHDAGDVTCTDGDLEGAQDRLATAIATLLGREMRPVVLGGGHEIAYGSFLGLAKHLGEQLASTNVLVVNFDAHFDLRQTPRPNSGTPFRQIAEPCAARGTAFHYLCFSISVLANTTALFERADLLGVHYRFDEDMRASALGDACEMLRHRIACAEKVYLSIDLDVLPAGVAPGVSAPAARGIALEVLEDLVDGILLSGKLALADIAELNPLLDVDNQTARIAARLAYRLAVGPRTTWHP